MSGVGVRETPGPVSPRRALTVLWANRWLGWLLALGLPIGSALVARMGMPRGPITTGQALVCMIGGLLVGSVAALATGTRWAILTSPAAYVAAFEVAGFRVDAPSLDGIHLDSPVGLFALVTSRGFHGVVTLVPMMLGATVGAGVARRLRAPERLSHQRSVGRYARSTVAATVLVALVALTGVGGSGLPRSRAP